MTTTPKAVRIPNCELESMRVIFWRVEAVLIFFSFAIVGGIFNHPGWGSLIGLALAALWEKVSAGNPGRPIHLAWWFLGFPQLKVTPASSKRRFLG